MLGWQVYHLTDAVALASQCASRHNFDTIVRAVLSYNKVSREDCEEFGDMPEIDPSLPGPEFRGKAKTVVKTLIKCAKDALENEPFHPTKQLQKQDKKKKPWWKQKQEL